MSSLTLVLAIISFNILLVKISITSDMWMISLYMAESKEDIKSLLMRVKEESEKTG